MVVVVGVIHPPAIEQHRRLICVVRDIQALLNFDKPAIIASSAGEPMLHYDRAGILKDNADTLV